MLERRSPFARKRFDVFVIVLGGIAGCGPFGMLSNSLEKRFPRLSVQNCRRRK
jgi:hypothetical protein